MNDLGFRWLSINRPYEIVSTYRFLPCNLIVLHPRFNRQVITCRHDFDAPDVAEPLDHDERSGLIMVSSLRVALKHLIIEDRSFRGLFDALRSLL
jgi:hypothetical protein